MRKIIYLFLLTAITISAASQKPGATIDVSHYEFGLQLSDADNIIKGNAVIEFSVLKETKSLW